MSSSKLTGNLKLQFMADCDQSRKSVIAYDRASLVALPVDMRISWLPAPSYLDIRFSWLDIHRQMPASAQPHNHSVH